LLVVAIGPMTAKETPSFGQHLGAINGTMTLNPGHTTHHGEHLGHTTHINVTFVWLGFNGTVTLMSLKYFPHHSYPRERTYCHSAKVSSPALQLSSASFLCSSVQTSRGPRLPNSMNLLYFDDDFYFS
jgi:hypothetical protein